MSVSSSSSSQIARTPPLVIVSQHGRHDHEARRLVRAQAARASAAQSRLTRARNREERDGSSSHGLRSEDPQHRAFDARRQVAEKFSNQPDFSISHTINALQPLSGWLATVLASSTIALSQEVHSLPVGHWLSSCDKVILMSRIRDLGQDGQKAKHTSMLGGEDVRDFHLPEAVPRGFARLQQKMEFPGSFIELLSRTSCFDFASPGAQDRIHKLLLDLVGGTTKAVLIVPLTIPDPPIQHYLRIACVCLTIFQGQRAAAQVLASDDRYTSGLDAAVVEATLLDQDALREPTAAEASLWAIFTILVTSKSITTAFHRICYHLLQDLRLESWSEVRSVLLDFIYPVSLLDRPSMAFFNKLQAARARFV